MLAAKLGFLLSALLAQDVELTTSDGVKLSATYTKPTGDGKRPALILIHQLTGKKEDWGDFPAAAAKAGFAVMAIDMRGHGKSANPFANDRDKQNVEKWEKDDWIKVCEDIKAAKGELAKKAEVDVKKIVLIGASIGANIALHYSGTDADIKAVAALSPGEQYKGVSAIEAVDKCANKPFFGAASENDPYSAKSLQRIFGKVKHMIKNTKIYKNAGHGTKMFGNEDEPGNLTKELLEWLKNAAR